MMLTFALWVLNVVLWVWFIGFLTCIPLHIMYIHREFGGRITVGEVVLGFMACLFWFLCIDDVLFEINEAFLLEEGDKIEDKFEKFMEFEIFRTDDS